VDDQKAKQKKKQKQKDRMTEAGRIKEMLVGVGDMLAVGRNDE
jgi:hypothetical protein